MKPVAIIINQTDFRDEEYFIPKALFAEQGIEVATISQEKGMCLGVFGGVAMADTVLDKTKAKNFSALVFTTSEGKENISQSEKSKNLAKEAETNGVLVFSINKPEQSRQTAQMVIREIRGTPGLKDAK